ncbi:NAD-dependent succinate-semialdehyde dehydrogenase [Agrobacterium tumefaciens]|uniref:Succinate-semialdehyde dehydrogenase n=1 Tax=Agrobacterium tumefaciens TaxID=358 RepID=A0A2L2LMQ9_AGRTU|nr:NAD-dependent succinate-semialdehyde dehydrogenase [Agrobacterium tumefaciens]AVH45631.1 succinate-semialdehyde dehydrogenase [Agrobacterium tumefaciens]NSY99291.1 NAD-dependent succinate-semialdehyde dehydrogenase [Agrobacterium tumefaciens]
MLSLGVDGAFLPYIKNHLLIDGDWVQAIGGKMLDVINPATGGIIAEVPSAGAQEATQAVTAAYSALPAWRSLTGKGRSKLLRAWHDLILKHEKDLARLLTAEQGKPMQEALAEIRYAASFVEWFAEEGKRLYGDVIPATTQDTRIIVTKEPVGVVAAITPWNFPAAMVTRKLAPALAAGCTIVLKPSELTPLTALALAALAQEAGFPKGTINVLTGDARSIGCVLTGDERVRKLTFTGSTAVGKLLAAACAETMKKVSMELGGNAAVIVFDDADIDLAVEEVAAAKFRNTGQTCVCANRIFVHEAIYEQFAGKLSASVAEYRVGDGLTQDTDQGPLINQAAIEKVEAHIRDAIDRGASVVVGGSRIFGTGNFFLPTVLVDVPYDALFSEEETFGPVAPLIRFATEDDVISAANSTKAGLAAYAFTRDLRRFWRVSERLEAGMVGFNTGRISTEVAPFGGIKESGLGREGSRYGIEDYLELKYVCLGDVR